MLASIGVLAIVGGAVAFKAMDSSKFIYIPSTTAPTTLCPVKVTGYTLTENTSFSYETTATTISTLPCGLTTVYKTI